MTGHRKSIDEQLAELEQRRSEIEARRQSLIASKRDADRKLDMRRKLIVGTAVLAHGTTDRNFAELLQKLLEVTVTRANDRAAIADILPAATAS